MMILTVCVRGRRVRYVLRGSQSGPAASRPSRPHHDRLPIADTEGVGGTGTSVLHQTVSRVQHGDTRSSCVSDVPGLCVAVTAAVSHRLPSDRYVPHHSLGLCTHLCL